MKKNKNTWNTNSTFSFAWLNDKQKIEFAKLLVDSKRDAIKYLFDLSGERLKKKEDGADLKKIQARLIHCKRVVETFYKIK